MANLAQFLALMANEIRRGKLLADLDTALQSSKFLKDDFLRLLPITRMDVDNVQLNFKMAVGGISVSQNESPFLTSLNEKLGPVVNEMIAKQAKEKKVSFTGLSDIITQAVIVALIPQISETEPSKINNFIELLSGNFSQYFIEKFNGIVPNAPIETQQQIRKITTNVFTEKLDEYFKTYKENMSARLLNELGRLDVVIEGQKLKEFPPDALVELQLTIIPKTFHWSLKPEYINKKEAPVEDKYTLMPGG